MNDIKITAAEKNNLQAVSKLHEQYINKGFLHLLGSNFLILLYKNIININDGILIVAKKKNEVIGFISGIININEFYKYFIKKNIFKVLNVIILKLFNIKIIKAVLEVLFYPKKVISVNTSKAELLSFVVKKEYQDKGIAKKLLNKLIKEFKNKGCKNFKVIVGTNLKRAINFYEKAGFVMAGNIEIHKGIKSYIYNYKI